MRLWYDLVPRRNKFDIDKKAKLNIDLDFPGYCKLNICANQYKLVQIHNNDATPTQSRK